ncbi:hypothetical protein EIP91_009161 [Steccherinum ochraceum]|uniref:F-box domain-containing protein n=1 Tax=Steccherinum ochraceum TaxID=92696 RepID=A0A4R0R1Z0_9APHY|nr:hypothetical protein EIP91_009161 [Steccherinum ochraceum]
MPDPILDVLITAQMRTFPKLSFPVLEQIIGHLSLDPCREANKETENVMALRALSLSCRALLDCCRRQLFGDVTLCSLESLTAFIAVLKRPSQLSGYVKHLVIQGAPDGCQSWVSSIPSRLLPILCLRKCTFKDVHLNLIHPSILRGFCLYGPRQWAFVNVAYSTNVQTTRLLLTSTANLSAEEPAELALMGVEASRRPGLLNFSLILGPLDVEWASFLKHQGFEARCIDANASLRAGVRPSPDLVSCTTDSEDCVQVDDTVVIGYVRKVREPHWPRERRYDMAMCQPDM